MNVLGTNWLGGHMSTTCLAGRDRNAPDVLVGRAIPYAELKEGVDNYTLK